MNIVKNILVWAFIWFIMAKEISKGNGKGFGKVSGINWPFMYENNGNYEKMKVKCHRLHVRKKMKENKQQQRK